MMHQRFHGSVVTILATVILFGHFAQSQQSWNKSFSIQENNVINVLVGFVYTSLPDAARPPYTFYSTSQKAFIEKYFTITLDSGEIRAKVMLDREENETYSFALLKNYDYIQITIRVTDVNDNSPKFSNDTKYLIIPENAPHYKITLGSAVDTDIGQNTIQSYLILSGNVDFAFNVSGRFSGTQVLLLDLGINGTLDYETTKSYTLIIRVYDGGTPRLYGDMTVYITIIDANDNQPIFNQSKYSAAVQENATIGQSIIEVFATDLDSGDNGKVSYIIDRQNSDPEAYFLIDEVTGIVTLQKRLDYELKTSYKLIVIARDNGSQPLQTSVLIDIEVLNINEQPAKIEVTFLTNQTGRVREDANVNDFVARISVSDPDASSDSNSSITVRLEGGEGYFGLIIHDRVVYLIVNQTLDRETKPWFNLTVVAVDSGTPPLFQSKNILLTIDDVNDNKPVFSSAVYLAEIEEMSSNGSSVVQVTATDRDIGENARVTYSINDDPDRHSDWFQIDTNSGLITTNGKIDCEVESKSQLIVVARDSGIPQMSSSATVLVSVLDINDKEPMFEHSQYSAAVPESRAVGSCILQVNATDPDCGVNGQIRYYISNDTDYPDSFSLNPTSGMLCIKKPLDYEQVQIYDFPIIAVDVGKFDTTAHVQITVTDVNDNSPIFYPLNYSTNEDASTPPGSEVITVKATDLDSGAFGTVTYNISSGNSEGRFRINETTAQNATTATTVLQRSDVECQATSFKIFVPKNLVPGHGPVTWRDSSCVVYSNGTHFVDNVGLRDCGTTLTLESDSVVFENDLIFHKNGTEVYNGSNIVTYGSDYEFVIPVKCVYPRNSNISTNYIPIVQQIKILERRNGQLDLTMRQYEAEDYNHAVPFNAYPRQVPLNNDIFIRVAMENNVTGLGLSADNCFATSTPSPVDPNWYQLISSGCPVNNAKIHPSGINDVKFSFHAFNFRHNTSGIVYVHCQVSVCLDTDPACVVGCVTRKKRSASVREGTITSNLISTGPFVLTADEGGVAMSTVVAAVSIAVAVIAAVIAIIGWTRKSKKGADS